MSMLWPNGVISVQEPITFSGKYGGLVTTTIKNLQRHHTYLCRVHEVSWSFHAGLSHCVVAQDPVADHLPPISFETIALAIRIGMIWRLHALGISLF